MSQNGHISEGSPVMAVRYLILKLSRSIQSSVVTFQAIFTLINHEVFLYESHNGSESRRMPSRSRLGSQETWVDSIGTVHKEKVQEDLSSTTKKAMFSLNSALKMADHVFAKDLFNSSFGLLHRCWEAAMEFCSSEESQRWR